MKSKIIALVSICLLALGLAVPALAGGWAVITLEKLPSGIIAGEPLTIRFAVRQHGRTLMPDLTPKINLQNKESGESFSNEATPVNGLTGHYETTLIFPSPGTWEWAIQAFTMDQPMPDLTVSASTLASSVAQGEARRMPILTGMVGLGIALAFLAVSLRSKWKWAPILIILGLLVSGAGFANAASKGKLKEQPALSSQQTSMIETGEALFVAKGCLACHSNDRIEAKYYDFRSEIGPNLTNYAASPEFLQLWLKDPASIRPNTVMPNLQLDETEIDALIAFLKGNPSSEKSPSAVDSKAEQVVTATPLPYQADNSASIEKQQTGEKGACSNLDPEQSLLVSYSREADSYISLVDPSSGESLCDVKPINLGGSPVYAVASDRSGLAVLSGKPPVHNKWELHWIDLLAWKKVDTGVVLDAWSQGMAINPEKTQVAIAYALLTEGLNPKLLGYKLMRVNISGKGAPIERELDIFPRLVFYNQDGLSILVYGVSYDYLNGTSTSQAKIRLYSAAELRLIWEVELSNVLEGVVKTGKEDRNDLNQITQWQPALALSPDREKLYIVHADSDSLTTVDLVAQSVSTQEILPHLSLLDRFLRWTSTPSQAKVLNGTTKYSALSPDGSRLYVSGFTGQPEKDSSGNWQFNVLPFGLQVIATADGSEVARIKNEASEIDLDVEGNLIFLRGWNDQKSWTDVLDVDNLEVINHRDGQLLYPARTLAGAGLVAGSPAGQVYLVKTILNQEDYSVLSQLMGWNYTISFP